MNKQCSKCLVVKAVSEFNRWKYGSDGLFTQCRQCANADLRARYKADPEYYRVRTRHWVENNREASRAIKRRYANANVDIVKASRAKWGAENPDLNKIAKSDWSKRNRAYCNTKLAAYRAAKLQATPPWVSDDDKEIMELVYTEADYRKLEVDHIIPLKNESVCGLHVYWNTQLLSRSQNASKSNNHVQVSL
jgi:hypothetical protein